MKKRSALASLTLAGLATLSLAASAPARPTATPLAVQQEPRGGNLIALGDRVDLVYDVPGTRSATGWLFVRNDLQRGFRQLPLLRERRPASGLHAVVPADLIRGRTLLYYAVVRDPASGRSATVPARGARSPRSAWILQHPVVVRLGAHRFGHTRRPDAVVARIGAEGVSWQHEGVSFGPQTFLVGREGSVWLDDGLANRLLVWAPGKPEAAVRSVPLPDRSADNDVALGPAGSVYVTGGIGHGLDFHYVLYRLSSTGQALWQSTLAGEVGEASSFAVGANSPLRAGPDGTLYCLVGFPGFPGGERGWMPVATPDGRPLSIAEQRRGTHWPLQPAAGGLRLVSEVYTARPVTAPREARFALVDRHGHVARSWRVLSRTDLNFDYATPEVVGGDPVVVLDVTAGTAPAFKWEYLVLRLGPHGTRARFSLPHAVFGDNILADVRVGPDGRLYQLVSSPVSGIEIERYSLGAVR